MRNIIFRGKALSNGEWVFGDLLRWQVKGETQWHIVDYADIVRLNNHRVDPETVGQFTGLCDKNGKEIYEGDILYYCEGYMVVKWSKETACFLWDDGESADNANYLDLIDLEVVGNIHDKEAK